MILFNYRLIHGLFHIALVISTRSWYRPRGTISVESWWQGKYEKSHVLIYLLHILSRQITCHCPRKMVLPRRQITRRKLCFYYTCKFGVISIKYVIILFIVGFIFQFIHSCIHSYLYVLLIEIGIWTYKNKYYKIYQIHHINENVDITFSAHDAFLE